MSVSLILERVTEADGKEMPGRWRIVVMRAGLSGNRNYYPDPVVREAVGLFDGAKCYSKPDEVHLAGGGKSFENLIGSLSNVAFVPGAAPDTGEIHADLTLIEADGAIGRKIREAYERGLTHLFGFSIDGEAQIKTRPHKDGFTVREAQKFLSIKSVDLIVDPGAGGKIVSCIEAVGEIPTGETMDKEQLITLISGTRPDLLTGVDLETITIEELEAILKTMGAESAEVQEARRTQKKQGTAVRESEGGTEEEAPSREALIAAIMEKRPDLLEGKDVENLNADDLAELLKEALEESAAPDTVAEAQRQVMASSLPDAAKARVMSSLWLDPKKLTRARVTEAISREADYVGKLTGGAPVTGLGTTRARVTEAESDKIEKRLDAFFKRDRSAGSFKEIYVQMTGDKDVTGMRKNCVRMTEAIGTQDWAEVCANSMYRELLNVYGKADRCDIWKSISKTGRANDFRDLSRVRTGGYGDIPVVAEGADYTYLNSPDDEAARFGVKKRGGLETITLEMIKNDDIGAIQEIPKKLAWAAKRTLAKGVLGFLTDNATIYNGQRLFHTAHGNLGTDALTPDSWEAARLAVMDQVEPNSNDRLGIPPSMLLVPSVLERTAYDMFRRNQNNDPDFLQQNAPRIVSPWLWTDPDMWFAATDPNEIPGIEVAFLDGQEEPEILIQDNPTSGSVFTNDKITYKIRHIWGAAVLDYRAFYCSKEP